MDDDRAMTSVHVIGNPTARGGRERRDAVVDALGRRGVGVHLLEATTPDQVSTVVREAVADGSGRIVCVGGDGLVRLCVDAVAGTGTVLGIVPHGTGNDFARAIGLLGGGLDDRVDRALGDAVPVDAIRTDHGWVASVATIGFSGDVTARANALSWPRGQFRYTVATFLQLPRLRTLPIDVTVDGEPVTGDTTLLAVGNTAYFGGGMRICPDARADDGRLQLVSIGDVPRRTFVRVFPAVFSGRHVRHPAVTTRSGTTVTLTMRSASPDDLWADGDLLGPLPVTLTVVPGALRIAGASC